MDPKDLRYTKSHEWASLDGDVCTVGITKYAVEQLTDVTFLELPEPGTKVTSGERFGEIESVKSVNDLYSPVSGEVAEMNKPLVDDPASIADDPFGKGWMIKIKVDAEQTLDHMMDRSQYDEQIASES